MCLAIPAQVIEINDNDKGVVNIGGIHREISLILVPDIQCGDYVIVHVGYALAKLKQDEAEKNIQLFQEMLDGDA